MVSSETMNTYLHLWVTNFLLHAVILMKDPSKLLHKMLYDFSQSYRNYSLKLLYLQKNLVIISWEEKYLKGHF